MDYADATLVSIAEDLSIKEVVTFDVKDFGIYRLSSKHPLIILPQNWYRLFDPFSCSLLLFPSTIPPFHQRFVRGLRLAFFLFPCTLLHIPGFLASLYHPSIPTSHDQTVPCKMLTSEPSDLESYNFINLMFKSGNLQYKPLPYIRTPDSLPLIPPSFLNNLITSPRILTQMRCWKFCCANLILFFLRRVIVWEKMFMQH